MELCSICDTDFDIEGEGGTSGHIGILPVCFCPTCFNAIVDMVEQLEIELKVECTQCGAVIDTQLKT